MLATFGKDTDVRDVQPPNTTFPMLVASGEVTEVRDVQPPKAQSTMLVTLSGMV
jgi:hypothetical protein